MTSRVIATQIEKVSRILDTLKQIRERANNEGRAVASPNALISVLDHTTKNATHAIKAIESKNAFVRIKATIKAIMERRKAAKALRRLVYEEDYRASNVHILAIFNTLGNTVAAEEVRELIEQLDAAAAKEQAKHRQPEEARNS